MGITAGTGRQIEVALDSADGLIFPGTWVRVGYRVGARRTGVLFVVVLAVIVVVIVVVVVEGLLAGAGIL